MDAATGGRKRILFLFSLYYLFLPFAIFLLYWVVAWVSLPLSFAMLVLPWVLSRNVAGDTVAFTRRQLLITVGVLLAWTVLSGIGGFVWQNRWDHLFRNAVFEDLVNRPWPVIENQSILTYYIGYWLPSAAVAKVVGSLWIGRLCQLIYGFVGILLAFLLTIEMVGNMKLRYLIPFIFFSGLDILGLILAGRTLPDNFHIEIWSPLALWESNTTLLFWVYNQVVPAWVATMLILCFHRIKGLPAMTLCFLSISAPFSVVGLFPLALYYIIVSAWKEFGVAQRVRTLFCPANIISALAVIPVVLYMMINERTDTTVDFRILGTLDGVKDFILILTLEILVYCCFIYRQISRSIEFYILLATSVFCLFVHMGSSNDFNSRVELPLNFYLTLRIMIYISRFSEKPRLTRIAFLAISAIAVITPCLEMSRILYQTARLPQTQYLSVDEHSIFEIKTLRRNFVADSIYDRPAPPLGLPLFRYPDTPPVRTSHP